MATSKETKSKIVILGGGFGGVRAALDLSKKLPDSEVILVDKNQFHAYYPDLYELTCAVFAGDGITDKNEFLLLKSTVTVPFEEIFKNSPNVKLRQGKVKDIDFDKNKVLLDEGELDYDFLILALGSESNFFGIPHLNEKAFELKTTADALNIRAALEELFKSRGKRDVISIVIGGGGFTGCELAGEMAKSIGKLAKIYQHPRKNISISLIEGSKSLLGSAHPWFGDKAKKRLATLGVEIHLESFITDVIDGHVVLKDGSHVPYDLLIWTAGVRANEVAKNLKEVQIQKNRCIKADECLHAEPYQNMFVIGDLAYCENPDTKKPLPMTAQVAMEQGHYVANCLAKEIRGKTHNDFHTKVFRFIVPLGGMYGIADLGFMKISGIIPWFLKRIAALRYFLSILPTGEAFRIWRKGFKVYRKND